MIEVSVDRSTLSKRRWRGAAEDGREFGFDLDHALSPGEVIFRDGSKCYVVSQNAEAVIEVLLEKGAEHAATLAWKIGNLHFPIEILDGRIRIADDPAIRQTLDREGISHSMVQAVFYPLTASVHGHHH